MNLTNPLKLGLKVIEAFLPENTKKKIVYLDINETKTLPDDNFDLENIPKIIGGSCKCNREKCFEYNIGPWNPDG